MTDETATTASAEVTWHRTPVIALGLAGAAVLAGLGLVLSRPDVIAVGLPLALAAVWALLRRPRDGELRVALHAAPDAGEDAVVRVTADVVLDAEHVQLAVEGRGRRTALAEVRPGTAVLSARTRLSHSGPVELMGLIARGTAIDGAWVSDRGPRTAIGWNAAPKTRRIDRLPVAPRLAGLNGSHEGRRAGQGGDFHDIHPFVPGDEVRRVDWRATARAARRPGDLLVRRVNALGDSSVVIAMDTAEDLGSVVAAWGTDDPDRTGVTSLDLAREAALSVATAAVGAGDRVAFHALSPGGRSVPIGGGARHLARLRAAVAATGPSADSSYRRSPVVPTGSIVFVLSTFADGVAARLATQWRAAGHAVVAIDVLPQLDGARLTREQRIALRTLLAERADILAELRRAGVEVVAWADDGVDVALRVAAVRQQRSRRVAR
ncbi:DUF58 domain-containing protein [Microbacterium sp. NPDC055502]